MKAASTVVHMALRPRQCGKLAQLTQNNLVIEAMKKANDAIIDLIGRGFTVLGIEVSDDRPLIWIEGDINTKSRLSGACCRRSPGVGGPVHTWQASLCGCRIQWETKGA